MLAGETTQLSSRDTFAEPTPTKLPSTFTPNATTRSQKKIQNSAYKTIVENYNKMFQTLFDDSFDLIWKSMRLCFALIWRPKYAIGGRLIELSGLDVSYFWGWWTKFPAVGSHQRGFIRFCSRASNHYFIKVISMWSITWWWGNGDLFLALIIAPLSFVASTARLFKVRTLYIYKNKYLKPLQILISNRNRNKI